MSEWNLQRVQSLINNQIEESLTLEYKAAGSLAKDDKKRIEITKDVSAMANSAGGVIIYGVSEHPDKNRSHFPEKLDPIDRAIISKEWLEHIIGNIQPRIQSIIIHPVAISDADHENHAIYVVEIPQSDTAHQAQDHRYYKRYNFVSVPMDDYEVRDTMFRLKHPKISLELSIGEAKTKSGFSCPEVVVTAVNNGNVFAQYVQVFLGMPKCFLLTASEREEQMPFELVICRLSNEHNGRFTPILPGTSMVLKTYRLPLLMLKRQEVEKINPLIPWTIHVDNAPKADGEILFNEIPKKAITRIGNQ
jgi:hypothetical protein